MRTIRFLVACALVVPAGAQKFYDDDPLLREPPPRDAGALGNRKLSDLYDLFRHSLAPPGERSLAAKPIPAQGVNTLGDPMEGAWWERRHYYRRMTREELQLGAGGRTPPDASAPWTIIAAKSEGVTPGFTVLDKHKRMYFVKFDSLDYPELSTAPDQISSKIFYALGYHVADNYLVRFDASQLTIGPGVTITDHKGNKRAFLPADLAALLRRAPHDHDGHIRATASLAAPGKPIGPYRYNGTRADDPNDTVPHEHRRDLRGMRMAAAWIDHDDSRAINTLDILVQENGKRYVRHLQLDFGSTLGSASYKPNSPRSGGEYLFSWRNTAINFFTLGFYVPAWARAQYPDLPAAGRFESERFDPATWVPEYPNPAFENAQPEDDFWMAKQIAALRDDDIDALVETGRYTDPKVAAYIAKCLKERRDKIARYAFSRVLPLDNFRIEEGALTWDNLLSKFGYGASEPVVIQWARFDNATGQRYPSHRLPFLPPEMTDGYWVAGLLQPNRPQQSVSVYVRKRGSQVEIVGKEYH